METKLEARETKSWRDVSVGDRVIFRAGEWASVFGPDTILEVAEISDNNPNGYFMSVLFVGESGPGLYGKDAIAEIA